MVLQYLNFSQLSGEVTDQSRLFSPFVVQRYTLRHNLEDKLTESVMKAFQIHQPIPSQNPHSSSSHCDPFDWVDGRNGVWGGWTSVKVLARTDGGVKEDVWVRFGSGVRPLASHDLPFIAMCKHRARSSDASHTFVPAAIADQHARGLG